MCFQLLSQLSNTERMIFILYKLSVTEPSPISHPGTARDDVLELLSPIIQNAQSTEVLGIASLSCGLIALGRSDHTVITTILSKIIEANNTEQLRSPFMRLAGLGVALCYMGCKDSIEVPHAAMDVFVEPFKTMVQTMLKMCAYAGTGDVLIVQELLRIVEERIICKEEKAKDKGKKDGKKKDRRTSLDWDYCMGQAIAVLAVAAVSKGEEIGILSVYYAPENDILKSR